MFLRALQGLFLAFGLALSVGDLTAAFVEKKHDGKVVSIMDATSGGKQKLVITDHDGNDQKSFSVAATVKVTLDKKDAKLTDLKKGDSVQITTEDEGEVTAVEATREKAN